MGHIEVRGPVLEVGPSTVIGLRRVRRKVLTVAGIIQRFRPHIIHHRGNSMPPVYPEAGLQGVVIRLASRILLQHVVRAVRVACEWTRPTTEVLEGTTARSA